MYQTSKGYTCPGPGHVSNIKGIYMPWSRACIKHQRDIHALVQGMYQTSKGYTCPGPGHVSNIKGIYMPWSRACIKHQREIHRPCCCSAYTVTTGTCDPPTQREISIHTDLQKRLMYYMSMWAHSQTFPGVLYMCSS